MYCNDMMNDVECELNPYLIYGDEYGYWQDYYDPDYDDNMNNFCEEWDVWDATCHPCLPKIIRIHVRMDVDGAYINYIESNYMIHDKLTMKSNIEKVMPIVKAIKSEYFEVEDENGDTHQLHKQFVIEWLYNLLTDVSERIADAWERGMCKAEFNSDRDRDPYPWEV